MVKKRKSVAYPPPSTAPAYYVAPPPVGYHTKDGSGFSQNPPPPVETKSPFHLHIIYRFILWIDDLHNN